MPEVPQDVPAEPTWEVGAQAYAYVLPNDADYVSPIVTVDRGALHLEARYAYEDLEAGSLWAGWNFGVGDALRFDATLMAGWVFGSTDGVAPGYEFDLTYGAFELTSEGQYVFDLRDSEGDLYYSWSEFAVSPIEWLRAGVVGQRTRVLGGEREFDSGLLLGVGVGGVWVTAYAFEPWRDDRYWAVGVDAEF